MLLLIKKEAKAFLSALPALITPVIILGGIYAGILTPSESAAIAGSICCINRFFNL